MPPLCLVSVTLDVYSIAVCSILIWCISRSSAGKKKLNQVFIWMCWFNIGTLLGDIPNWLCEGLKYPWYPLALRIGCFLLYACGILLPLAYTRYVIYYLEPQISVHKGFSRTVDVLAVSYVACMLATQFNGMVYWIDDRNYYHRGDWYLLSQVLVVLILLIDTFVVFKYRKYLRGKEIMAFSGYIVLPIAAVIVQFFFYGLSLTYTASTVVLLVIFIDIQSEQEFLIEQMEKKLLQARLSMLLGQIRPHFLYNSLTVIANLCDTDAAMAKEELVNFAHYLRANIDSLGKEELITFEEELKHTKFYLSIEKLRFEERLKIVYHLRSLEFWIPPLVLQPIVENAVRYGASKQEDGGTVTISTDETEKEWLVTVEDDGPGFNTCEETLQDGKIHVGINNVRQRLEYLCRGTLELSGNDGRGTRVTIRLPKRRDRYENDSGRR